MAVGVAVTAGMPVSVGVPFVVMVPVAADVPFVVAVPVATGVSFVVGVAVVAGGVVAAVVAPVLTRKAGERVWCNACIFTGSVEGNIFAGFCACSLAKRLGIWLG